jgi:protein-S-isoprenylcysteine O-methyltransferase Ste14
MIIRSLLLLLPLCLWAWYVMSPTRTSRQNTATFLGFVWAFHAVLVVNIFLVRSDMLVFAVHDTLFYGVPLDWVVALSVCIGALVPLTRLAGWHSRARLCLQAALVTLFYSAGPVVTSNLLLPWLIIINIVMSVIPAMCLSDWTDEDSHIGKRAILQSLAWAVFLFWMFPAIVFNLTEGNWSTLLHKDLPVLLLYLLPLCLPGYLLINALYHFAVQGDGTAFPYDPPKRLVTNGVYRYISNPMQTGITLAMGWWGIVIESLWVSVSAIIAVVLFVVFKDVCNGSCAIGVNNPEWEEYQRNVPKWWPRVSSK